MNDIIEGSIQASEASSAAKCRALTERAIQACVSHVQSSQMLEAELHSAMFSTLVHAATYGDIRLLDEAVKSMPTYPGVTELRTEIIAWVRLNSPIRWNAKGRVLMLRDGDEGYKPFDLENAASEPFYETKQAVKARKYSQKAHKSALEPVRYSDFRSRFFGLRKFIEGASKADKNGQVRGIQMRDAEKINAAIYTLTKTFNQFELDMVRHASDKNPPPAEENVNTTEQAA